MIWTSTFRLWAAALTTSYMPKDEKAEARLDALFQVMSLVATLTLPRKNNWNLILIICLWAWRTWTLNLSLKADRSTN